MSFSLHLMLALSMVVYGHIVAVFEGEQCTSSTSCILKVPLHPQETTNWCWVATAQMVMEYLGHGISQCKQINDLVAHGQADCCLVKNSSSCNQTGWPDFKKYGFNFKRTNAVALQWDSIVAQIRGNKPFIYTWAWRGGGKHMKVATGYFISSDGIAYVTYNNPLDVNKGFSGFEPYTVYVSGPRYKHWDDFFDIVYGVAK